MGAAKELFVDVPIISTRMPLTCRAQQPGLLAVWRVFFCPLLFSAEPAGPDRDRLSGSQPDPAGHHPRSYLGDRGNALHPADCGGFICGGKDLIQARKADIIAVSTTCQGVWEM